jgi:hypothetical protein
VRNEHYAKKPTGHILERLNHHPSVTQKHDRRGNEKHENDQATKPARQAIKGVFFLHPSRIRQFKSCNKGFDPWLN